ncbi:arrestin domain-containing protein C31A2.12-like [Pararge aegeria]|uniref:arrestin domain-containing protein C31A2.12-like n=1 Tax=Pararge aegeria TaxID=116150 RepID=UPI0019D0661B|nr:arrestin domain-containing protein C31A2.12-like [Pararge aegeria]
MVWDTCTIVLHGGSNGVYFTNDIITGSVVLELKQKRKVEQMYLKVTGITKAMWSRPSPTLPYIKIYSQQKKVLDISMDVFKELQAQTVKPGIMSCQFDFMLPADLPPTYKDSVAKVYYRIIMTSKNAFKIKSKHVIPFIVMNSLNINHIREYKIPMVYELQKTFGNSAKFLLTLKTYRGFASTQEIPFEAILTNENKIKVNKISVALIQKVDYNVSSGYYSSEKTVCKTEYIEILNLAKQICMFSLEVPLVIPSTINQRDPMVDISYALQVKVNFLFHLPLYTDIPVAVASVPVSHDIFYK